MSDLRQYSSDELLRDGSSIHVRAIRSDDKQRLREHSEGLSARSVYFRFLGPKKRLTDKDLAAFTDLDFVNRVALVATVGKGEEEKIIGVGRYALSDTAGTASRSAELAFSVVDEISEPRCRHAVARASVAYRSGAGDPAVRGGGARR
jgi:hypothetical protein